jgi:uncharacterized protein YjbI with pentapeptide repeats
VTEQADAAFREFVETLRSMRRNPVPRDQRVCFSNISFNEPGAFFPLRDCVIEKSAIEGQVFWMSWNRVSMHRVDLSHTGGEAHWTECDFEKVKFHRLHASISLADCIFDGCDFNGSVWKEPFFIGCTFRRLSLKGLALQGATFIACRFEDVDLGESRWYESKTLEIRGSWKGELGDPADAVARRLFSTPGGGEFSQGGLQLETKQSAAP